MQRDKKIRTRIAPSPTGFAHIGTAYTALFNYAFAKKNGGKFILRVEDTDLKRNVKGAEEAIYEGLSWLGILWDEGPDKGGEVGPYRSSERLDVYKRRAKELISAGKALEDDGAVRFKNLGREVKWRDLVRGEISFPGSEVGDFVLLKSDGFPAYNFGVVVDDIEMKITHVIRGEEHISNTPRQLALYKAFGVAPPEFAHLPTIRNEEHKKLSKRRDPVDLGLFRKQGYLPYAIVNFLGLLGWSHPKGKEVFSLKEFVREFDLNRVRRAGPILDLKKLDWLNGIYIRGMGENEFVNVARQYISAQVRKESFKKVAPLVKERITKLSEIDGLVSFLWKEPQIGRELFESREASRHIASALHALSSISEWKLEIINEMLEKEIEEKHFKKGDFYMSLRLGITGSRITPPISESIEILGQDKVLYRLEEAEKVLIG